MYRDLKLCSIISLLLLGVIVSANSLSDLRGLRTKNSRFPIYNKGRLQMMIYSEATARKGNLIATDKPFIEIIRDKADVDLISAQGGDNNIYELNAHLKEIVPFWLTRMYAEAVILSKSADIDQKNRQAGGGEEVFFRSPLVDIDGVGFEADYGQRSITIKNEVKIVLRTANSDPNNFFKQADKIPVEYEFITASCDKMNFDFENNIITLIDNVKTNDPRGKVFCDKMTVYLNKAKKGADVTEEIRSVSSIVCEGNVVLTKDESAESTKGYADKLIYDVASSSIAMFGTPSHQPRLHHQKSKLAGDKITLFRQNEMVNVENNCQATMVNSAGKPVVLTSKNMDLDYGKNYGIFTGDVKVVDESSQLNSETMELFFSSAEKSDGAKTVTSIMPELDEKSDRKLERVYCKDEVYITYTNPESKVTSHVTANSALYNLTANTVDFKGDVKVRDQQMELDCDEMTLFLDDTKEQSDDLASATNMLAKSSSNLNKIETKGNVYIRNLGQSDGKVTTSTLRADHGVSDLTTNITQFKGNVKMRDARLNLDCDNLDIESERSESKAVKSVADTGQVFAAPGEGGTSIKRIKSYGNVKAADHRGKLDCDKLQLLFDKIAHNSKKSSLQSGNSELVKILMDGNVHMRNIPTPKTAQSSKSKGMFQQNGEQPMSLDAHRGFIDLRKNISEYYGDVELKDDSSQLNSQELYLFAQNEQEMPKIAKVKSAEEAIDDIDDDPMDSIIESEVPSQLSIGEGRELKEIIAIRDVKIVRKDLQSGNIQTATGERAHYIVADQTVTLTGTEDKLPLITDPIQGKMSGERVVVNLATEEVTMEGQTRLDKKAQ